MSYKLKMLKEYLNSTEEFYKHLSHDRSIQEEAQR